MFRCVCGYNKICMRVCVDIIRYVDVCVCGYNKICLGVCVCVCGCTCAIIAHAT